MYSLLGIKKKKKINLALSLKTLLKSPVSRLLFKMMLWDSRCIIQELVSSLTHKDMATKNVLFYVSINLSFSV